MSARKGHALGRREVLKAMGVATGAIAAGTVVARPRVARGEALVSSSARHEGLGPPVPPSAELLALFEPLRAQGALGRWQLVEVHAVTVGAIPVVLADEAGRRFQVDVFRRDRASGAPRAVAHTRALSVFLANRGDGGTSTHENEGLGAMALAKALARLEEAGARSPAGLLTLRQRIARHPDGIGHILRT